MRPRPRNGEDEKKMQRMKEDIEADLDSLAKKLRNFCEFASVLVLRGSATRAATVYGDHSHTKTPPKQQKSPI